MNKDPKRNDRGSKDQRPPDGDPREYELVEEKEELASKKASKEEKELAMTALGVKLEEATVELTATLLALHGLEGLCDLHCQS